MFLRSHMPRPSAPRGSIFSNFETVQLSAEERLFLHAARMGEAGVIKDLLENQEAKNYKLKITCVDYMGRNALFLAVDAENVETIEILLEKMTWESIEEALLHAISRRNLHLVRVIIEHPTYISSERQRQRGINKLDQGFFRTEEKYQYPPEVTPLMLAAHLNDHEIVQLFISRGYVIDRPHAIDCKCDHCQIRQDSDSLKRSRSRLNAYRALASPAYMALSSVDPITTTFELRQEMKRVACVEKEFKREYLALEEQCMDFAYGLMDLCRGTQEVEAILGDESGGTHDPLARLHSAIAYEEKKFVAHANCQQHLTSIWYGKEMKFMHPWSWIKKSAIVLLAIPALPFLCLAYLISPNSKVARVLRCPVSRFIAHTASHLTFLFLLGLATFGLEGLEDPFSLTNTSHSRLGHMDCNSLQASLRPLRKTFSKIQILIVFWIIGLLWTECKQVYHYGAKEHFMQYYNFMDWGLITLYLASYTLRCVAQYRITLADLRLNVTVRADDALNRRNSSLLATIFEEAQRPEHFPHGYFIRASRFEWSPTDPEIVADILFAIANVISFARTTYVMPSHEMLGPLQIALGRMLGDITRFIVLFLLVLLAFMVGMTNLYHYYGSYLYFNDVTKTAASENFKGMPQTVYTLFFSIFGLVPLTSLQIKPPEKLSEGGQVSIDDMFDNSTVLVHRVGLVMFATYLVVASIVLINILIAMMSHSFDAIQGDNDVEWKFARMKLWMNYIDKCGTLPVPFNIIPSAKSIKKQIQTILKKTRTHNDADLYKGYMSRRREANTYLPDDEMITGLLEKKTTYSDIMMRLIRRYLFNMDRCGRDESTFPQSTLTEDVSPDFDGDSLTALPNLQPIREQVGFESTTVEATRESSSVTKGGPSISFSKVKNTLSPDVCSINSEGSIPNFIYPDDLQRRHSLDPRSVPKEASGFARSRSVETLHREITRRATLRRRTTCRRPSRRGDTDATAQLEAIKRSQWMLDARLQDMQSTQTEEITIRDDLNNVKQILEKQESKMKHMNSVFESMQDEIHKMNDSLKKAAIRPRRESSSLKVLPGLKKSHRRCTSTKSSKEPMTFAI